MKPSKDILNELSEIAPALAKLNRKNFYQVSDGYFEESSAKMSEMIEDIQAHEIALPPLLASIRKEEYHRAPSAYFSGFSDSIIGKIHAEEVLEELVYTAPTLAIAEKKNIQEVPANYFEVFPMVMSRLTAKDDVLHESPLEHQISRWSNWASRAFGVVSRTHYAFVLACTIAFFVVLAVNFTHSTLTPEEKIFAQMQQVPDSELHHYMGKHRDEFDEHTILHHINDIEFMRSQDKQDNNTPDHVGKDIKAVSDDTSEDIID